MAIARSQLIDTSVARWYHCISRCVRRAFLLGEGPHDRKAWIENRLEELAQIFAIAVGGFSVMDNHLHVLLRLDPDVADGWSDEEVVRRWGRLFPPRDKSRQPLAVTDDWVQWRLKDSQWVATARERLQSISWFMKCLKEPLSRLANRQDKVRGAFFEARFKSVAILDDEALLAIAAYIDLNPVAAGIAEVPETSEHTSIKVRSEHVDGQGRRLNSKRPLMAAWRVRARQPVWKSRCGCARSRIGAGWILVARGCWKDSRWVAISFWSITRGGSFARERRRSRRSWPEFSTGWGVMPRAGRPGWTNCAAVDCSAVSSPPVESSCAKLPNGWTCDAWQTWLAVRRDDANLNFGRHRQRNHPLPPFISHPQATGAVRPLISR